MCIYNINSILCTLCKVCEFVSVTIYIGLYDQTATGLHIQLETCSVCAVHWSITCCNKRRAILVEVVSIILNSQRD